MPLYALKNVKKIILDIVHIFCTLSGVVPGLISGQFSGLFFPGGDSGMETPVPIPNTVVKHVAPTILTW